MPRGALVLIARDNRKKRWDRANQQRDAAPLATRNRQVDQPVRGSYVAGIRNRPSLGIALCARRPPADEPGTLLGDRERAIRPGRRRRCARNRHRAVAETDGVG